MKSNTNKKMIKTVDKIEPSVATSGPSGAEHYIPMQTIGEEPNINDILPVELVDKILTKLDLKSRLMAERVCTQWRQLVTGIFNTKKILVIAEKPELGHIVVKEVLEMPSRTLPIVYSREFVPQMPIHSAIPQIIGKYRGLECLEGVFRSKISKEYGFATDLIKWLCEECGPGIRSINIVCTDERDLFIAPMKALQNCPDLREFHITALNGIAICESLIGNQFQCWPRLVSFRLDAPLDHDYSGHYFKDINAGIEAISTSGYLLNATAISRLGLIGVNQLRELTVTRFDPFCMPLIGRYLQCIKVLSINLWSGPADNDQEFALGTLFEDISRLKNLEELRLVLSDNCAAIDYTVIEELKRCPKLKSLNLIRGLLAEDCVEAMEKFTPNLVKLCLIWCRFLSDDIMSCLASIENMRQLSELSLKGNEEVTDTAFEWLIKDCQQINRIDVSQAKQITADAICECIEVCGQQPNRSLTAVFSHDLKTSMDELDLNLPQNLSVIYMENNLDIQLFNVLKY